ncbi:hypothetical protein VTH06DRAFT_1798 [Thermothelomyces fergusii]
MADHTGGDQELMYCHACHHQWQRAGESIECPVCMSASTEIVSPENDPRQFHNRLPQSAVSATTSSHPPTASPSSTPQPTPDQDAPVNSAGNDTSAPVDTPNPESGSAQPPPADGQRPRVTVRFTTADLPPVTFITFVTGPAAPLTSESASPVPVFGMHFFPSITFMPITPPPTVNTSPSPETADQNAGNQQNTQQDASTETQLEGAPQQQQQQSQAQPQSRPHADQEQQQQQQQQQEQQQSQQHQNQTQQPQSIYSHTFLATLLHSLLYGHVAAAGAMGTATFFHPGDAVYTQEAFDRILTQLREQAPPGGPPPASQAALDRLQAHIREVDDQMLGGDDDKNTTRTKCAICVDDMARGEKAAVLPCDHFFHGDCVLPWLKMHGTCPVCRRSVEVDTAVDGKPAKLNAEAPLASAPAAAAAGAGAAESETRGEDAGAMDCS